MQLSSLLPALAPVKSASLFRPRNAQDWLVNNERKIFKPQNNQWKIIQGLHQATHLGKDALKHLIKNVFDGVNLTATIKRVC